MKPKDSERGMALVLVLLSLVLVSGLTAAMLASARTEFLIARNHEYSAHAQAAAEAGLNHALEVAVNNLRNWQANGFADSRAAASALLRGPDGLFGTTATNADNGSLEAFGVPRVPARLTLAAAAGTSYEARLFDDDDPARGIVANAGFLARTEENGDPLTDANAQIVVRAIGYGRGDTRMTLEATVGPVPLPAIVTGGDLAISGNPNIAGMNGSVHSNGNMTISGNPTVSEDATSSGTYTVSGTPNIGGESGGGRPNLSIPPVRAIDHRPKADFILTSGGQLTLPNGTPVCDASADNNACQVMGYGWEFNGPNGWVISGDTGSAGTYYVEGNAKVSGNPGSPGNPLALTIIATGSIEIGGNPDLRPDYPELAFVTDGDLKISGNIEQALSFEGQMFVHEQLMISGNPTLAGQIIVEDGANVSTLVVGNSISGNLTLVYNGLVGSNTFAVTAWREVR